MNGRHPLAYWLLLHEITILQIRLSTHGFKRFQDAGRIGRVPWRSRQGSETFAAQTRKATAPAPARNARMVRTTS